MDYKQCRTYRANLPPLPEMALLPRKYALQGCGSYSLIPQEAARYLEKGTVGGLSIHPEGLRRPRSRPNLAERLRHEFIVAVNVWNKTGTLKSARIHGRDPYGTSAWLIRRLVEILQSFSKLPAGIISPEKIFPAEAGLEELIRMPGFRIEFAEDLGTQGRN